MLARLSDPGSFVKIQRQTLKSSAFLLSSTFKSYSCGRILRFTAAIAQPPAWKLAIFLKARERLRKSATIECGWRRMYELDRYGLALAHFEEHLETLYEKHLNACPTMAPHG